MRDEYIDQFRHFWRMFEEIIDDFDNKSWFQSGFALTTPARLAFHILQSTKYYINDRSQIELKTGKSIDADCSKLDDNDLPFKEDIILNIPSIKQKTDEWLQNIDFDSKNIQFNWTGKTMMSVALFLIRHSQFHMGEINALLNEYKKGNAEDHFAETL